MRYSILFAVAPALMALNVAAAPVAILPTSLAPIQAPELDLRDAHSGEAIRPVRRQDIAAQDTNLGEAEKDDDVLELEVAQEEEEEGGEGEEATETVNGEPEEGEETAAAEEAGEDEVEESEEIAEELEEEEEHA